MKRFILFCLVVGSIFSCDPDGDNGPSVLSYDGPNETSPIRPDGLHEFAAQFTSDLTMPFQGRQLEMVRFFLTQEVDELRVRIYGEGTGSTPGNLLYEFDLTNRQTAGTFNEHRLSDPVDITGDDLWISMAVRLGGVQQSIGCDAEGSGQAGGDWLFFEGDNQWLTFRQRTNGQASVNWNIQGVVSEE